MLQKTNMSVNINRFVATVVNWQWYSFPRPPWNISYFSALFFYLGTEDIPSHSHQSKILEVRIPLHCLYHKDKIRLHNRYHYHHSQSNHCHHHPILVIIINLESMSSWGQDGDPCEIVSWRLVLLRLIGWLSAVTWIEEDCFKQQYQCWPFLCP